MSSDSEALLDEIVITSTTSMDNLKYFNPLYSPIHICDNNIHSDDNTSTIIRVNSMEANELVSSASFGQQHQLQSQQTLTPSSAFKNSKSRRMEYSMRGLKLGVSNPSQDSAFGSMTDGELSRASSFKLSSFQSVSSPIDEGVEEMHHDASHHCLDDHQDHDFLTVSTFSASSSPCRDKSSSSIKDTPSCSSRDPSPVMSSIEPPKLVINDQNASTIYTSSPIRKCATTEVFSQKYRVSSFEDMSYHRLSASFCRKPFKSFEDEQQRIESAFIPSVSTSSSSPTPPPKSQKPKHQQHSTSSTTKITSKKFKNRVVTTCQPPESSTSATAAAPSGTTIAQTAPLLSRLISGKEKNILWKNSILSRKNNLIKSTESFFDSSQEHPESEKLLTMNSPAASPCESPSRLNLSTTSSSSKSRIFCLSKLKQNPIRDSVDFDPDSLLTHSRKPSPIPPLKSPTTDAVKCGQKTSVSESAKSLEPMVNSSGEDTSEASRSISQSDIRKFIERAPGHGEEEDTPLLDGMELSPISPTSSDEVLAT